MNEATKPVNPEKEAYHREAESRMHTFSYKKPAAMQHVKELVNFVRTPNVRVQVQVVTEGGENNLHYHTNSDGVWMVLRGRAKFYGVGDKLLGELGEHEGIVIPGGARYWFEKVGEPDLEILHITAVENAAKKTDRINIDKHKEWMQEEFLQQYEESKA